MSITFFFFFWKIYNYEITIKLNLFYEFSFFIVFFTNYFSGEFIYWCILESWPCIQNPKRHVFLRLNITVPFMKNCFWYTQTIFIEFLLHSLTINKMHSCQLFRFRRKISNFYANLPSSVILSFYSDILKKSLEKKKNLS